MQCACKSAYASTISFLNFFLGTLVNASVTQSSPQVVSTAQVTPNYSTGKTPTAASISLFNNNINDLCQYFICLFVFNIKLSTATNLQPTDIPATTVAVLVVFVVIIGFTSKCSLQR